MQNSLVVCKLFASYSHKDAHAVNGLVCLLRAVGAPTFLDHDSIPPGSRWMGEIERGLEQADLVLVFWTCHAASSKSVREEYERAALLQKPIIPVLLDSTPLRPPLSEYQWISLRDLWSAVHRPPLSLRLKIRRWTMDLFGRRVRYGPPIDVYGVEREMARQVWFGIAKVLSERCELIFRLLSRLESAKWEEQEVVAAELHREIHLGVLGMQCHELFWRLVDATTEERPEVIKQLEEFANAEICERIMSLQRRVGV